MPRRQRFRISKKDLKLFMLMCLIALAVGAGIAVIDQKSRSMLKSLQNSAFDEVKQQAESYKVWKGDKKGQGDRNPRP